MATLAFRISDSEKQFIESYAKFQGKSLSQLARDIIIGAIEDEEDIQAILEYEKRKAAGTMKLYSFAEVIKHCGLDGEI